MKALRNLMVLAALCTPLAVSAAETADAAVAGLIVSLKDAGSAAGQGPDGGAIASLFERLLPHLARPSRQMADSMLRAWRAARLHDDAARKAFGATLEKEEGYTSAEGALTFFVAFATPLAMLRRGSVGEIVERANAGDDALYRVRWVSAAGAERDRAEESIIAVKEGADWKLLVPAFGSLTFGNETRDGRSENYSEREKKAWTAGAMRAEGEATQRKIDSLAAQFDSMTQDVKAGRFSTPKAYVDAIAQRAQKM
jgi:hypothetical protein